MIKTLFKAVVVRSVLGKGGMKKMRNSYKAAANNAHAEYNQRRERTAKRCVFTNEKIYTHGRWNENTLGGGKSPREQHQEKYIKKYL